MPRLIDADKVAEAIAWLDEYDFVIWHDVMECIDKLPTVDIKRNGYWEKYLTEGLRWKCSECGSRFETPYHYCPNCGAKMEDFIDRKAAMNVVGLTTDAIKIDPIETKYVDAQGNELVAVVHCKECRYAGQCFREIIMRQKMGNLYCPLGDNGYCSMGRKKDETD